MPKKKKPAKKAVTKKASKKASKKKIAKKTAPKKKTSAAKKRVTTVKISSKVLGEAPVECEFVLTSGKKLKSLYELVDELEEMSEDVFTSHVNEMKNDFSSWIRDVFDENSLAKNIQKVKDRMKMQREIMKKIVDVAKKEGKRLR